jgi:hypothetical protein
MLFHARKTNKMDRSRIFWLLCFAILGMISLSSGCASKRYLSADRQSTFQSESLASDSITFGQPNERLDKVEHVLMAPRRWVRSLRDKEDVKTEPYVREQPPEIALEYLATNQLSGIHVDVDVYQPKLQWQRLREADHIGPLAKYSLGTISLLREALMPARVFNQDRYNHFTKTLSLNSHNEASALYESAMVKEHVTARFPGVATVLQRLPIGTTIARVQAGSDSLTYARSTGETELEESLYPVVYSSVVSETLGDVGVLTDLSLNLPQRIIARVAARQVGKAVGSWQTRSR